MRSAHEGKRIVVVVVGMHRCGTSVLTRGLLAMGLYLGNRLLPPSMTNPKGYWEDSDAMEINRIIMGLFDANELNLHWFTEGELRRVIPADLYARATGLVRERLSHTGVWAFKDPRTARLLPFWQTIFREMGVEDKYVIACRNPLDSAASFRDRHNLESSAQKISLLWGGLLWAEHMLCAVNWTQGRPSVVVDYDFLMRDPVYQLNRVGFALGITCPATSAEVNDYAAHFVDHSLRHYVSSVDALESCDEILPIIKEAYRVLRRQASLDSEFHYDHDAEFWRTTHFAFSSLAPALTQLSEDSVNVRPGLRFRLRLLARAWWVRFF